MLPAADLRIMIESLAEGRRLTLSGGTAEGRAIVAALIDAENAGA